MPGKDTEMYIGSGEFLIFRLTLLKIRAIHQELRINGFSSGMAA